MECSRERFLKKQALYLPPAIWICQDAISWGNGHWIPRTSTVPPSVLRNLYPSFRFLFLPIARGQADSLLLTTL